MERWGQADRPRRVGVPQAGWCGQAGRPLSLMALFRCWWGSLGLFLAPSLTLSLVSFWFTLVPQLVLSSFFSRFSSCLPALFGCVCDTGFVTRLVSSRNGTSRNDSKYDFPTVILLFFTDSDSHCITPFPFSVSFSHSLFICTSCTHSLLFGNSSTLDNTELSSLFVPTLITEIGG